MENKFQTLEISPTKNDSVLNIESDNRPIVLSWENIDVFTPSSSDGLIGKLSKKLCRNRKEVPPKHIIKNVNGIARPGSILAIMGASGAGKTTLLNILNFRNTGTLKISGNVKINGEKIKNHADLANISGYVQQDDLFISTLKVIEQLKFQAMLRMDSSTSYKDKLKRVEEVMLELNLKKCENTMIGSAEKHIKGISGGEKRRLAFACEMITNPNLLFADEPTSGLDSFMALSIVDCMRKLALQGKTIICTIHQPSSEIFQKFDRLCLMSEGRLAYIGRNAEAPKFFASNGYNLPSNFNPADFYIMNLAIIPTEKDECFARVNSICDNFEKTQQYEELISDLKEINQSSSDSKKKLFGLKTVDYNANFFVQLRWLLWRYFFASIRDNASTIAAVMQAIVISIIFGLIFLRINLDQSGIQNINGILFLFLTQFSFTYVFNVLNSFPSEIPIFLREHQNGVYSVPAYFFSKIFIELPGFIIFPFISTTIIYWMANLNNDGSKFIICCIINLIVANCAVSFGYLVSAISPNANVATGIASPLMVPLMIFSGFFLNNSTVPPYFIWLKYISWFNYAYELLIINQWDNIDTISCPTGATKCFVNGEQVISTLKMNKSNIPVDYIALFCLLIGYRMLAFIVLFAKSFKK